MSDLKKGGMSESLFNKNVYGIFYVKRDGADIAGDDFTELRKEFFENGKKSIKRNSKNDVIKGFNGKLKAKIKKRGFDWKRTAGKTTTEESFSYNGGTAIVKRDFYGVITGKTFFDKNHIWIKSEYFDPTDQIVARVIFKPTEALNSAERFEYDADKKVYTSTTLYPTVYKAGTAEQSIINANFGEPELLISTNDGIFGYTEKEDALARERALGEIEDGTIVMMPAWEVKDGKLQKPNDEEAEKLTDFEDLDTPAVITEATPIEKPIALSPEKDEDIIVESINTDDAYIDVDVLTEQNPESPEIADEDIIAAARRAYNGQQDPQTDDTPIEEIAALMAEGTSLAEISDTKRFTDDDGNLLYSGALVDGKKEGFGSHYYKDGSLCYAGTWKNGEKNGAGVSFRNTDHAIHIAKWENGKSSDMVTLFDAEGNLKYSGKITNGQKQGAGFSRRDDGSIFISKWQQGNDTGFGSLFDGEGNLVYTGMWKDGKRNGTGTEFGKNGEIVFSGEWKDDKEHNGILYKREVQNQEQEDEMD